MAEYRYAISLRVSHPSMDLEAISNALEIEPRVLWKSGGARRTPKGVPLPGVYETGFWSARLSNGTSADQDLPSALSAALDRITKAASLFIEIAETGGRVEFFIGWFFDEGNSGEVLDHRLLSRLAALKIDLSFDVYPGEDGSSDD